MPHNFKIARNLVVALAGFGFALGGHAEDSHSLRLMPRISVGNAEASVSAAVLGQWEALAGFSLAPARRTLTGAWIIDLPADTGTGQGPVFPRHTWLACWR